jgi:hypothetical protein
MMPKILTARKKLAFDFSKTWKYRVAIADANARYFNTIP